MNLHNARNPQRAPSFPAFCSCGMQIGANQSRPATFPALCRSRRHAPGFDRFGIDHFNPTADRIRTLSALVEQGYTDRIHLSHDAACFYDFMIDNPFFADEHPDYLFISNGVIPRLQEAGVTSDAVAQMMEENPRSFFS
jgi:hypothetical protein